MSRKSVILLIYHRKNTSQPCVHFMLFERKRQIISVNSCICKHLEEKIAGWLSVFSSKSQI
jgi:hypothetical protein